MIYGSVYKHQRRDTREETGGRREERGANISMFDILQPCFAPLNTVNKVEDLREKRKVRSTVWPGRSHSAVLFRPELPRK